MDHDPRAFGYVGPLTFPDPEAGKDAHSGFRRWQECARQQRKRDLRRSDQRAKLRTMPPADDADFQRRTRRFQAIIGLIIGGIFLLPGAAGIAFYVVGELIGGTGTAGPVLLIMSAVPFLIGSLVFFPALAKFRANRIQPK